MGKWLFVTNTKHETLSTTQTLTAENFNLKVWKSISGQDLIGQAHGEGKFVASLQLLMACHCYSPCICLALGFKEVSCAF